MPWTNDSLAEFVVEGKRLIHQEFGINPDVTVLLCTLKELNVRISSELSTRVHPERLKKLQQFIIPLILGKYFKNTNEIWLIEGEGDKKSILIHELLHSIQICNSHRENIVDYLTYKITDDPTIITPSIVKDWNEIEKMHGIKAIKKRLLQPGDCEEF